MTSRLVYDIRIETCAVLPFFPFCDQAVIMASDAASQEVSQSKAHDSMTASRLMYDIRVKKCTVLPFQGSIYDTSH